MSSFSLLHSAIRIRLARRFLFATLAWLAASAATVALAGPADDWERMKPIRPKGYACGFVDAPLQVDGKLDEPAWQAAAWSELFVDIEGDRKPRPRFATRVKMLWDAEFFYIAADLEEPHVWGTLTKHDSVIFHDNDFEVFIDPDGDNHEYYELELNALNTTWDLFLPRPYKDGGKADNGWEIPGLKTAVHVRGTLNDPADEDRGWSVELAIPWKVLGERANRPAPPQPGDRWRVNFSRVQWRHEVAEGKYRKVPDTREDNWVWSPQGIIDMHRPERWGIVEFSKESPSAATLSPDVSLPARDVLMEVYHRQKSYHAKEGRWAGSLTELGMQMPALDVFPKPLELRTTDDGFHATLVHSLADGKTETWHVRQDSRLWRSDSQSRRAGPVLPDESGKARLASRAETPNSPAASNAISDALSRAGENRPQIQKALDDAPAGQRAAMEFLVAHMPDRDLASLTADYLLENVRLACQARDESPWKEQIPEEIFLNNVLPYASINERRDAWRKDFYDRCRPLVEGAKSPSLAAAMLNQKIYKLLNVRYSTGRPKADQSPFESIQAGTASCSGLAVLLIDACRAVGVPARFVGTPLWADGSGNHSWVEVWDQGWHFTGAAEPSGDRLDEAWFLGRASKAQRDDPRHAIYAVSYQRTPLKFPLVWDRRIDYVFAVNVTDRYVGRGTKPPVGTIETMFRVLNAEGQRCAATIVVRDAARKTVFEGTAKDERFDANDHALAHLVPGEYRAEIRFGDCSMVETFKAEPRKAPVTWRLPQARVADESPRKAKDDARASESTLSAAAVEELASYLKQSADERPPLDKQPFASVALSCGDATVAAKLLWDDHAATIRKTRSAEMEARLLTLGDLKMPFTYQIFGEKPATGRSLYISMHGGGGAPKSVNDRQWENQKRLYKLEEGVYLVPRAPTDTWNLWHQEHIDKFFDRLIENLVVLEDVDPDRVYIMGYSAGGDGVYQLAPRMADRLAAAAMMAGHPNETSPLGLRNLPFTLHVGALDAAYDRNKVARQWEQKLADLHRDDPQGYEHLVKIHADKGHWMDREDAVAIGWMARHRRNLLPERIVWKQDDVAHTRFYWLAVGPKDFRERAEVVAQRSGQRVDLQTKDVDRLTVRAADELFDLDEPITITRGGQTLFEGRLARTIATLAKTLSERGDPRGMFSAEVRVEVPSSATP